MGIDYGVVWCAVTLAVVLIILIVGLREERKLTLSAWVVKVLGRDVLAPQSTDDVNKEDRHERSKGAASGPRP